MKVFILFIYLLKSFFAHFAYENQYQDNEKERKEISLVKMQCMQF